MLNAVPKLLHARMLLVAPGGFLTGYDDKTLNALVAMAIKYDVKLLLCEPNYFGGMFTRLLIPAVQQCPYECGVEDAKFRAVTKEPITDQHRLIVCPSRIEQDFDSTQIIGGERGPLYRLFYQIARMVRAEGVRQTYRAGRSGGSALQLAPEFGDGLDKFFKHAVATKEHHLRGTLRHK